MQRRHILTAAGSLALAAVLPGLAQAADRTIRIVVPYAAGGPTDAMARILQEPLQQSLGATVLIENVPGAGGALGAPQVLRAPADGNTWFLGNNGPSAVTPLLQKAAAFDPLKDFVPVSMVAKATMVLAASAKVPAHDMASFLAHARANPGKLNYASAGIGSLGHLGSELLVKQAGLQMTHVPYKGQAPTLNALLTDEVQMLLTTPTAAMRSHVAEGRIKLVAVTSQEPSPFDPEADLVHRAVPGFTLYSWFALMAKAGTPDVATSAMARALQTALADGEVKKRFEGLGIAVDRSGPATVKGYIEQDVTRWSAIIKERGIRAE